MSRVCAEKGENFQKSIRKIREFIGAGGEKCTLLINHTFKIHLVSDSEGAAKRKIRKGSSAKNIYLIKCKNTRFVVFRGNKYIRRSGGILSPKIRWTRVKLLQFHCYTGKSHSKKKKDTSRKETRQVNYKSPFLKLIHCFVLFLLQVCVHSCIAMEISIHFPSPSLFASCGSRLSSLCAFSVVVVVSRS